MTLQGIKKILAPTKKAELRKEPAQIRCLDNTRLEGFLLQFSFRIKDILYLLVNDRKYFRIIYHQLIFENPCISLLNENAMCKHGNIYGARDRIRTDDLILTMDALLPTELRGQDTCLI